MLAQTVRLLFVALGGAWLIAAGAGAQAFFLLAAASMAVLGVLAALSVALSRWGARGQPV